MSVEREIGSLSAQVENLNTQQVIANQKLDALMANQAILMDRHRFRTSISSGSLLAAIVALGTSVFSLLNCLNG